MELVGKVMSLSEIECKGLLLIMPSDWMYVACEYLYKRSATLVSTSKLIEPHIVRLHGGRGYGRSNESDAHSERAKPCWANGEVPLMFTTDSRRQKLRWPRTPRH